MRDTNNGNFSGENKAERMVYIACAGGPSLGSKNTIYCIVIHLPLVEFHQIHKWDCK